jgi:putative transposase
VGQKKAPTLSVKERRAMIETASGGLSVRRQCELLGLPASSFYYRPRPVSELDLEQMRLLDEQFTRTPFYGVERMTWWLRSQGHGVNVKRVRRLLRLMGLMAVYPKPRLSLPGTVATHYVYLLGGMEVLAPDQAWATDITYIRLRHGFCFLCAILDWFSRYVVAWSLSVSLEAAFCLDALELALATGRKPWCLNSDQGSQFTCQPYVGRLLDNDIKPSWDGKGRWIDPAPAGSSSNGCGAPSNTSAFTCTTGRPRPRPAGDSANTSPSTTTSARIPRSTTSRLRRYIPNDPERNDQQGQPARPVPFWSKSMQLN